MDNSNLAQLEANFQQSGAKPVATNNKKSWITSLIPAATSILGGIGGSILAPGIGTAAGGAAGGVLGKKIQDLVTGNHSSLGSYLGEGALGSLGGLGEGLEAARGAGAALKAGEGGEAALQALRFGSKGAQAIKEAEALRAAAAATEGVTEGAAKGIPVKYIESVASGTGKAETANKLLINPTVGDVSDAESQLLQKGYKLNGDVSTTSGVGGAGNQPVVNMSGTRTAVPLNNSEESIATTLQPKPRMIYPPSVTPEPIPLGTGEKAIIAKAANRGEQSSGLLNKVSNKGQQMESRAGGFNVGQKIGGKTILPKDVQELEGWLADKGISPGSAESRLAQVSAVKNTAGKSISDIVSTSGATISNTEQQQLADRILEDAGKISGPGKAKAIADAQSYVEDIKAADTPQKLLDLKRAADNNINFNAKSASVAPETQQVAKIVRGHLGDTLETIVPDIATHNADYSTASKLEELLAAGAKNAKGARVPIIGNVGSGIKQAGESIGGKVLQKAGNIGTSEAPSTITGLVGQTAKNMIKAQAIPRLIQNGAQVTPPTNDNSTQSAEYAADPTNPKFNGVNPAQFGYPEDNTSNGTPNPQNESDQIQQGLRAAALQALSSGDTKGLANITAIASMFAAQDKASADNLTKTQQTTVDNANTASSTLDTMLQQLKDIGGGAGRVGGIIGTVKGKLGLDNKVSAFNSTKVDAAIALAQALSGSTRVPPPSTLKLLEDSMPNYNDNPEEAQRKVDILQQRLSAKLSTIPGAQ